MFANLVRPTLLRAGNSNNLFAATSARTFMSSMPKSSPKKINTASAAAAPYVAGSTAAAKAASTNTTHHVHDANCGCGPSGSAAYSTQASPTSPAKPAVPGAFNTLPELLQANKSWASTMMKLDPNFFANLANQQSPQLLWIGCSDSRVPANQIINLAPGEVFVHRNIANVVNHGDLNALSVLQYAVDVLKVKHVIVTGHYGCGGVAASMTNQQFGLIDNWLRTIKDVYQANEAKLDALKDPKAKLDLMVELNVANSVRNVCATTIVQNAWKRGQELSVHGWCYRLEDGVIRDLDICISQPEQISRIYNVMSGKTVANA